MDARVVDAPLDPSVGAVCVVHAHVCDACVIRDVERVWLLDKAFAVDGKRGVWHSLLVVDCPEQAVEIFVDAFGFQLCGGLGVSEGLVQIALGMVGECHFVFDECVFRVLLFGFLVLRDGFVVLALLMELYALIDKVFHGLGFGDFGCCV